MIDALNMSLAHGTGIATYARNLVEACSALGLKPEILYGEPRSQSTNSLLREILFFDKPREVGGRLRRVLLGVQEGMQIVRPRLQRINLSRNVIKRGLADVLPKGSVFWNSPSVFRAAHKYFALTGRFLRLPNPNAIDVAHWTCPIPISLACAKNVYTIHDLVPLRLPYATLDNKAIFFRLVDRICRVSDHVVTVSESARSDIEQYFPQSRHKITNTFQPINIPTPFLDTTGEDVANSIRGQFGLEVGKYLLYYGAIEPKKNVGRLLEAYLTSGVDLPLVIVGRVTPGSERDLQLLVLPNIHTSVIDGVVIKTRSRVHRIDYLPFRQLVTLIRGAAAVTFPSIYEGFGLPIVEAMTCGVPVLTSNFGAMSEIAGEASLQVDPYSISDIGRGLRQITADARLRERLVRLGYERCAKFSNDRYIASLSKVYSSVLGTEIRPAAGDFSFSIPGA